LNSIVLSITIRKQRHSNQTSGSERRERDDRDGAQEKTTMVVQRDIL
jgi:hypothetical protein